MNVIYQGLLGLNLLMACAGLISLLAGVLGSGPRLSIGESLAAVAMTLVFIGTAVLACRLHAGGRVGTGVSLLGAVWVVVALALVIAASTARWN